MLDITSETRLFWVVDSMEANEEIYETLEDALIAYEQDFDPKTGRRIRICKVRNTYFDQQLKHYNYNDLMDTFTTVKEVDVSKYID